MSDDLRKPGDRDKVLRKLLVGRRGRIESVTVEIGGKQVRVSTNPLVSRSEKGRAR